jgi:hypothetical protein
MWASEAMKFAFKSLGDAIGNTLYHRRDQRGFMF